MRVLVRSCKMSVVQWVHGHSAICQTVRKADGKTCNLTSFGMDTMDSTNNHTHTQQCVLTSNPIPTHFIPSKRSSPRWLGRDRPFWWCSFWLVSPKSTQPDWYLRVSISRSRQMSLITPALLLLLPQSIRSILLGSAKIQMRIPSEITKQWENKPYSLPPYYE